jgi:hypothetical protein
MLTLLASSLIALYRAGRLMENEGLEALQGWLGRQAVDPTNPPPVGVEALCHAMDIACAFYPVQVLCLQRSAAVAMLLKRAGWDAKLVIGVTILPFNSHAWAEVGQRVVNDKPYMRDIYRVMQIS